MPERQQRTALHRSVFARLVAIMLVMAAVLLGLVGGFYFAILMPRIHASRDHLVSLHARAIAESAPDFEMARAFATKLDMQIRFEAADHGWTTDESVPTLADIAELPRRTHWGHMLSIFRLHSTPSHIYYVAETQVGHYIFARSIGGTLNRAHTQMLILLLALMVAVFVTAYLVLKRALRPLRLLDAGVTQLSEGQLDVVVPKQSQDEFGALTDAFNHMVRRVRDMVRARDRLLLDVSHELRSPLTRLKVALEMLPESERKQQMTADVAEMETMVTELLELHRMSDRAGMRLERVNLVTLVRETAERYKEQPPGVVVTAPTVVVFVEAEADRVRTVLRNLIENALKFSLPDSRAIEVDVSGNSHEAKVRVVDDGPGVPDEDVDRLFEPFVRTDPSRSKKTGGYGLGLSICKRIMEAHSGTIALVQNDGRGVTLVLTFPVVA